MNSSLMLSELVVPLTYGTLRERRSKLRAEVLVKTLAGSNPPRRVILIPGF